MFILIDNDLMFRFFYIAWKITSINFNVLQQIKPIGPQCNPDPHNFFLRLKCRWSQSSCHSQVSTAIRHKQAEHLAVLRS